MDFEEWFSEYDEKHQCYPEKRECFEAGQQSKQAEIDELKAKIDELTKWAEFHAEDYNIGENESDYNRGWFHATCKVLSMLKGEQQ